MYRNETNWAIKSCVASLNNAVGYGSSPPASTIRKSFFAISVFATFQIAGSHDPQITCPNRACAATASGVVPISINSVEPLGTGRDSRNDALLFLPSLARSHDQSATALFTELEGNAARRGGAKSYYCSARSLDPDEWFCGLTEKCSHQLFR